jgi:hypothetical protein
VRGCVLRGFTFGGAVGGRVFLWVWDGRSWAWAYGQCIKWSFPTLVPDIGILFFSGG